MKNKIVVDGVTYYRELPDHVKSKHLIEHLEWIKHDLAGLLQDAQDLYDNMQEEQLRFSVIEAEGYLRAMKTVNGKVEHIDECMKSNRASDGDMVHS